MGFSDPRVVQFSPERRLHFPDEAPDNSADFLAMDKVRCLLLPLLLLRLLLLLLLLVINTIIAITR